MKKNSLYLIIFELSVFAFFVLLNCYAQTEANRSPLGYAVKRGNVNAVKDLLSKGANPNKTQDHETLLVLSTKLKTDEIFNLLVNAKGIDLDALSTIIFKGNGSKYTRTALISAVHEMKIEQVRTLLEKGANPDLFDKSIDQDGNIKASHTALMNAIILNRPKAVEIARILIENSRNIDAKAISVNDGLTALNMATKYPLYNDLSKLMIKKGAKLTIQEANDPAISALESAIQGNNTYMVNYLLNSAALLNEKKDNALMHQSLALRIENLKTIKILLDSGIDTNIQFTNIIYPSLIVSTKGKDPKEQDLQISRGPM